MTLWRPTWLIMVRAVRQFPRLPAVMVFSMVPPLVQFLLFGAIFGNLPDLPSWSEPTDNYYEYLAPAVVFFTTVLGIATTVLGIANAGVSLVTDFQNRYFLKLMLAPINVWSILLGRLFSDGFRVYLQAGVILVLSLFFGARVATGVPGALLMLLLATLFSISTVGILITNVAIKTKDAQAVQAIFPLFFILIFLTSAFMPRGNISNDFVKGLISGNPAEYVVRAIRGLMLESSYNWGDIGIASGVIAGFMVLGVAVTYLNFRSLYR
jgi:ABC-2 type transport system permease protein